MKLLVSLATGWNGTIERFAASGNRFQRPTKKGCGDAAALSWKGLSLMCADLLYPGLGPGRENRCRRAFVVHHSIVKPKNGCRPRMFQFFPPSAGSTAADRTPDKYSSGRCCQLFLHRLCETKTMQVSGSVAADDLTVRPRIARATVEAVPPRLFRPRRAARGQFAPSRQAQAQPIDISTAIRIRSEWFLAPSFCFKSEVVLATVL